MLKRKLTLKNVLIYKVYNPYIIRASYFSSGSDTCVNQCLYQSVQAETKNNTNSKDTIF